MNENTKPKSTKRRLKIGALIGAGTLALGLLTFTGIDQSPPPAATQSTLGGTANGTATGEVATWDVWFEGEQLVQGEGPRVKPDLSNMLPGETRQVSWTFENRGTASISIYTMETSINLEMEQYLTVTSVGAADGVTAPNGTTTYTYDITLDSFATTDQVSGKPIAVEFSWALAQAPLSDQS